MDAGASPIQAPKSSQPVLVCERKKDPPYAATAERGGRGIKGLSPFSCFVFRCLQMFDTTSGRKRLFDQLRLNKRSFVVVPNDTVEKYRRLGDLPSFLQQ
jgi:hypothetical protein